MKKTEIRILALSGLVLSWGLALGIVPAAPASAIAPETAAPAAPAAAPEAAALPPDQARAQAAMAELGTRLRSAMREQMQTRGPIAAVDFCHVQAPQIAAQVAAEHGVKVGRTALRYRNPDNAPLPWQQTVLSDFAERAQHTPVKALSHVEREGGRLRLARAIAVEGPCLLCHGRQIAEPIRAAIAERYPQDQATGFSEGDLRGMIWAEVTSAEPATPVDPAP